MTETKKLSSAYWKAIARHAAWAAGLGFIGNLIVLAISLHNLGGHSVLGLVFGLLCQPTAILLKVVGAPLPYEFKPAVGFVLMVSAVNASLITLLCVCLSAVIKSPQPDRNSGRP